MNSVPNVLLILLWIISAKMLISVKTGKVFLKDRFLSPVNPHGFAHFRWLGG